MLYEIAHFVKDKFNFVWNVIEWGNAIAFRMRYAKRMATIPSILQSCSIDFTLRATTEEDAETLESFFARQPKEAFTFFNPHAFDTKAIQKVIRNKAFLTYIVEKNQEIVGYFFLRCFVNGKCFRGKIVDAQWRNKGIAKQMGAAMTRITSTLGIRMYGTIAPDNFASMASSKAVNEVKVIKTLPNGYYFIEYLPKE